MNLKKILLTTLLSSAVLGAMAVPAKKDLRTFRQSDGTEISVRLIGDEHFHSFVTTDGLTVSRNSAGDFVYQTAAGLSNIMAHNPELRKASEVAYINKEASSLSAQVLAESYKDVIEKRKAKSVSTRGAGTQVPNIGNARVPILLVQYQDIQFKDQDPLATFNEFFITGQVSARKYFQDQSNGKYDPQFDIYGPVTLANERAYYGGNISGQMGADKGCGKMVAEAALALDGEIDFRKYDNDGDGECDVLIVLYAGVGEASCLEIEAENSIWPCQWSLSSSEYRRALYLDNTSVDKFAVFNELNGDYTDKIDGIGTFCHEFSHCLGLPDYYDTNYGNKFGMGPWSLMDYGEYNNNGYTPIGYSAYEKEFMGWINIEEGEENKFYTLPVLNSGGVENDKAVKLTNPSDRNEYFILENRQQQGWDLYMPTEGMFIYHVTYNKNAWDSNTVNNYSLQRMTPVPCDNSLKLDYSYGQYSPNEKDLLGDLWPYNGNNEFTDTSVPAQNMNTGGKLGKPVTEITRNADGTISFWLMKGTQVLSTPVFTDHYVLSDTSATINWESGLENDATFTLEVREHVENGGPELMISTIFNNDEHGWDIGGYGAVEDGAIRLGSAKQYGSVTSPIFEGGDDGMVTIKFNAKYYGNDASKAVVSVLNTNSDVINEEIVPLTSVYNDYKVLLEGKANTSMRVSISIEAPKKRIYLASADIYNGVLEETRSGNNVMLFEGIEGTSHTLTNLISGAQYDYRIKAIPRDPNSFSESGWSARRTFDLSASGITGVENETFSMEEEYFTLQGMKVERPTLPGIYIVKKGGKSYKKAF